MGMTRFLWTIAPADDLGIDEYGDVLFVMTAELAEHWRVRTQVLSCDTWGEVRALGDDVYLEVLGLAGYGDYDDFVAHFAITGEAPGITPSPVDEAEHATISAGDLPDDGDAFSVYDLGACIDGDWPPSPCSLVFDSVPFELIKRFGTLWVTTFNGDYGLLKVEHRSAVFAELEALGHELVETPWISEVCVHPCGERY